MTDHRNSEDLVTTPGGPRSARQVHEVRPGEAVARQPEGALETQAVYGAISELPEDFRMALVAVDILGLSYGEAAKALDTSEATITTRLYRARQRVARQFPDQTAPSAGDAREGSGPERSLA